MSEVISDPSVALSLSYLAEYCDIACCRRGWRTGWDSNPRWAFTHGGFQDRCLKPLGHPSGIEPAP
jgi:hypothetical protein